MKWTYQLKCHELINLTACQPPTENFCYNGKCKRCPTMDLDGLKDCDVMVYKWQKVLWKVSLLY